MQVSKEGIERIKGANPLHDVITERGISLRKKGQVLVASCPFHSEKTASFTITPAKGLYHCFGCGAGGDVIGFVTKLDKVSFPDAVKKLASRAGLDVQKVMTTPRRVVRGTPIEALTHPSSESTSLPLMEKKEASVISHEIFSNVVDHYHRTFCERADAQEYLAKRGLTDGDVLKAFKVGYADGSLLKLLPRSGEVREQLLSLGVITAEGRELLGGCIVIPIPDPTSGEWTSLYGRGLRTPRHCYLPGPLRGVLNFQAARSSEEVILTESVIDALSFHQAGIATAIPIYGTNGFTGDHVDLLKRERVRRVILALDGDAAGRKATDALKEKLGAAGIAVRIASFPEGIKDANELLVSRNGDASEVLRQILDAAEPRPLSPPPPALPASVEASASSPLSETSPTPADAGAPPTSDGSLLLFRDGMRYTARVQSMLLGRLRVTVKVEREVGARDTCTAASRFHVDTLDLYASRSRAEFARRVSKAFTVEAAGVEAVLLALVVEAEKVAERDEREDATSAPTPMTDGERGDALAFLRRADLLDQVARDIDALGYVGEGVNKRLLYLVAISRKLDDPLSAIVLSQSGAGKSGLTEAIERLCPPEDVVLLTRLTPQSLYYTEPGFLDRKLVIVEERYGSLEADYSIRVLQSRKKLIAAAPIKDPQTGNMRTKVFTVEARAAFIEATTASSVNHENATRCFELSMDESAEQTHRIHERQRLLRTERGLLLRREADQLARRHWNAQRLLEPLPVVIPFADRLTFPTSWMRTRRDHARFLNLIEVGAFLHQHQRERSASGAIMADIADYEIAYGLAGEVLAETLTDVKKPLREAYARIRELSLKGNGLTRSAIRDALSLPDSTVRRWLNELCELEYLEADSSKQGKAVRYALAERAPKQDLVLGLLSPEDLRQAVSNFATSPHFANPGGGGLRH